MSDPRAVLSADDRHPAKPDDARPPVKPAQSDVLLSVVDLKTHLPLKLGTLKAVDSVSFTVRRGEAVGIVGESGSGKTMTCLSVIRLLPIASARIVSGSITFDGVDLTKLSEAEMRQYRGGRISIIMQDPLAALNPVLTIGDQVSEPIREHMRLSRPAVREKALEMLESVRIPRPAERFDNYPHQFSGGMRQRIVAAMGLGTSPSLLIADEPTTALDVTSQAEFLALLRKLQTDAGLAVLWITHDLGVVAQTCDRVNIMYAGRIVESGTVRRVFSDPQHPYTEALLKSIPKLGEKQSRLYQISGQPPDLMKPMPGCPFYKRCPKRMDICTTAFPPRTALSGEDYVHCWAKT